jgi:hypothetical protein
MHRGLIAPVKAIAQRLGSTFRSMTMGSPLVEWPRRHFVPGGKHPFLFYVVYGRVDTTKVLSRSNYRSNGIPDGIDVMAYGPTEHADQVAAFCDGYLWDQLTTEAPNLAATIAAQDCCLVLTGEIVDPPTPNYLREVIGFLTFCLDAGGVAIYDPLMFKWWGAPEWRSHVFNNGWSAPRHHVVILVPRDSDETEWIHTRGMRKFGRPDISIHKVGPQRKNAVIDLCNRFIELLAFGGIVRDGSEVRLSSLPSGMKCFRNGSEEDPDFNNEHIEIVWPNSAEATS